MCVTKFSTVLGAISGYNLRKMSPLLVCIVALVALALGFSTTWTAVLCSSLVGRSLKTSRSPPLASLDHQPVPQITVSSDTDIAPRSGAEMDLLFSSTKQVESRSAIRRSKEVRIPRCFFFEQRVC